MHDSVADKVWSAACRRGSILDTAVEEYAKSLIAEFNIENKIKTANLLKNEN